MGMVATGIGRGIIGDHGIGRRTVGRCQGRMLVVVVVVIVMLTDVVVIDIRVRRVRP